PGMGLEPDMAPEADTGPGSGMGPEPCTGPDPGMVLAAAGGAGGGGGGAGGGRGGGGGRASPAGRARRGGGARGCGGGRGAGERWRRGIVGLRAHQLQAVFRDRVGVQNRQGTLDLLAEGKQVVLTLFLLVRFLGFDHGLLGAGPERVDALEEVAEALG